MIQHVERFCAEHEVDSLRAQRECLHNCWIDVDPGRGAEAIPLDIAIGSGCIGLKCGFVQLPVYIGGSVIGVPVCPVKSQSGLRVVGGIHNAERLPRVSHKQTAQSPRTRNGTHDCAVSLEIRGVPDCGGAESDILVEVAAPIPGSREVRPILNAVITYASCTKCAGRARRERSIIKTL